MMRIDGRAIKYTAPMQRDRSKGLDVLRLFLGRPLYWVCQVYGWGGIWGFAMFHIVIDPPRAHLSVMQSSFLFLSLGCLSHLYRIFIQLNHWCDLNWKKLLPKAAMGSFVIALIHIVWVCAFFSTDFAETSPFEFIPHGHLIFLGIGSFFLISAWSGIYFGYHLHVDYQKMQVDQLRLQVALREAEHRALSAQINPHFLFNSLNTLRSLIDENPEKAREAVTELARLFRASLKTTRKNLITLREELETVQSYLSLEQSRFENRLVVHGDVPAETMEATLPPLSFANAD